VVPNLLVVVAWLPLQQQQHYKPNMQPALQAVAGVHSSDPATACLATAPSLIQQALAAGRGSSSSSGVCQRLLQPAG
jgi:hypothetical protein